MAYPRASSRSRFMHQHLLGKGRRLGRRSEFGLLDTQTPKCRPLAGDGPDATEMSHECLGQVAKCSFKTFRGEFLVRYATVHIKLNLKFLLSRARQHLVQARQR